MRVKAGLRRNSQYAKAVDRVETGGTDSDVNAVVALFTEDAVFDIGAFGLHKGHAAIREAVSGIRSAITLRLHFIVTSSIDIPPSGNEATRFVHSSASLAAKSKSGRRRPLQAEDVAAPRQRQRCAASARTRESVEASSPGRA